MKLCYLDTETTGLDANVNDIIQIAGIIEIDGQIEDKFEFLMRPFDGGRVDDKALQVNKRTRQEIAAFENPQIQLGMFQSLLARYVHPDIYTDCFLMVGHNVEFDKNFIQAWFRKAGQGSNYRKFFDYKVVDTYPLIFTLDQVFKFGLKNHKLETIAQFFGIPIQAHDAMADITATREVLQYVIKRLQAGFPNGFI